MIIGGRNGAIAAGDILSYTKFPSKGIGGTSFYSQGLGCYYNGQLFIVRTNTATLDLNVFNYTSQTSIWTETNNTTGYPFYAQYGQYIYVGYCLTSTKKLCVKKIDLSDGTAETLWTDGTASGNLGGSTSASWDSGAGLIAFYLRGADRRAILSIDPSDDTVTELVVDANTYLPGISCTTSYIYYVDATTIWKRMEWDGTNKTTVHTIANVRGPTGPNGLHMGSDSTHMYDADGTNDWYLGVQLRGGYFLSNSAPYYLVGWETGGNTLKLYKLATGSAVTILETLSSGYDLGFPSGFSNHMPYGNFEGIHGLSYSLIGQSRSALTIFPDREHN